MASSHAGVVLYADTGQIKKLAERFGVASRVVRPAFRAAAFAAAQPIVADAKARASYSHRIPGSIHARMIGNTVEIVAGGAAAPDAAPIENKGRGFVRHPVFARGTDRSQWTWTGKDSHPAFLAPAVEAGRLDFELATATTVVDAVEKAVGGR